VARAISEELCAESHPLTYYSVGLALADTLDDLISSRRIEPQLAMRVLQNFDQAIASVLGEKVKARMNFKVGAHLQRIM